jgi:hypothetical protein
MAGNTGKLIVKLDGKVAPVKNVGGAFPRAEVVTSFSGAGAPPKRQISSVRYTDLRFDIGVGMGGPILSWLNAALAGNSLAKSGTIIQLDDLNRAVSYLDFTNARIVEFGIPASDPASTEDSFTLVASIGGSTERPGDNVVVPVPNTTTKPLSARNFRLTIAGLPTTRVRTISPLPFRRTTAGMLPPDLIVTVPNIDVAPWKAWVKDFIVDGHNGQDKEKQGAIEWLTPDFSTVVAKLTIGQIGIFELAPVVDSTPAQHRASMYFEFGQLSLP